MMESITFVIPAKAGIHINPTLIKKEVKNNIDS
jgi:hypothetical protein